MSALTSEQVLALAPDAASAKAGAALATPRKWARLGRDDAGRLVWGECQGSGATPYQTRVDLGEPAFKCSCPSRKFPCKHALGLMLLHASDAALLAPGEPPPWVAEWIASRGERAERSAERRAKQEGAEPRAPDATAQARRAASRAEKVAAGIEELALWLHDLVRAGIASAPARPSSFWHGMAARLVDAQAPGAARMVRELAALPATGADWPERMLRELGRLHLLVEGHRRIDTLPAPLQAELRARIGFTTSEADLGGEPGVADRWQVIGRRVEDDERLRVRRTWLHGATTGRRALLLHFAHGSTPFAEVLPPVGAVLDAELAFFPGAAQHRAAVRARLADTPVPTAGALPAGEPRLADATAAFAERLASNPWLDRAVLVLDEVIPDLDGGRVLVRDASGDALPLAASPRASWPLLALSGGHPVWLSGEWDGERLLPLAAARNSVLLPLGADA